MKVFFKEFFIDLLVGWLLATLFWGFALIFEKLEFVFGLYLGLSLMGYMNQKYYEKRNKPTN